MVVHPTSKYWRQDNGARQLRETLEAKIKVDEQTINNFRVFNSSKKNIMLDIMKEIDIELKNQGFVLSEKTSIATLESACDRYYNSNCTTKFPRLTYKVKRDGRDLYMNVEVWDNLWCYLSKDVQSVENHSKYSKWEYLLSDGKQVNFRGYADNLDEACYVENKKEEIKTNIISSLNRFISDNRITKN